MEKENNKWHGSHHYSDKVHLAFALFLFLGVISLFFSYFALSSPRISYRNANTNPSVSPTLTPTPTQTNEGYFCTQDAKLCPDGSWVGRDGPNCEFKLCPGE